MKLGNFNKDKIFFTSDTHFFHRNIIDYCNRPFRDARQMNDRIVDNWNSVVPKDGIVFHLGDVSLGSQKSQLKELIKELNGGIHLIVGNHEKEGLKEKNWLSVNDISEIEVDDEELDGGSQRVIMCHYPIYAWNGSHKGTWHLYGHVHGGLSKKGVEMSVMKNTSLDVGVDCHGFTPLSWQDVKSIITKQCLASQKS